MLECPQQGTYGDPSPKHHLYPKRTTTPPKSPLFNFSQEATVRMQHYRHNYDHNSRERTEEIAKRLKREGDVTSDVQVGGRHLLLSTHGSPLNTVTPCAACKLLRRRCAQECPFSPYFSPHEPQKFASVHKVFGASNVSKMLLEVPESQRADAANSLVYEANIRMRDPIYGCMGAISALQNQVHLLETELNAIRAEILKHKYRQSSPGVLQTAEQTLIASGEVSVAAVPQNNIATHPSLLLPSLPSPSSPSIYTSINSNSAPATGYSSSVSNGNNVAFFG